MPKTGRSESIGKGQPKWTPGPFHCPTCATERGVSVPKFGTCPHHPSYTTIRAAAPDLYEALEMTLAMAIAFAGMQAEQYGLSIGRMRPEHAEAIDAAKRALAKARGES